MDNSRECGIIEIDILGAKMKKVCFVINGVGGCGKDSLIHLLCDKFKVRNVSSITPINELAKMAGWDGVKTDKARKFLFELKSLVTEFNDYPTKYILDEYNQFLTSDEQIMFIHIRESENISRFVSLTGGKVKTLLITPRAELTHKVYGNHADDDVYKYDYDYTFANDRPLDEIAPLWINFIQQILDEQ